MKRSHLLTVVLATLLAAGAVAAADPAVGVVNINTADAEQLQLLPRVGPALAGRILEFRKANGDFASVDELVAVKGIGEASLKNLRPYITTKGSTTLTSKVRLPRQARSTEGAGTAG